MSEIILPCGRIALIDEEDLPAVKGWRLYSWVRPHTIYVKAVKWNEGKPTEKYLHKLLTGYPQTDHKNRNGLDNRRENLRPATRSQNNMNSRKRRAGEFKGISRTGSGKWQARARYNGKNFHGGSHHTPEEAARAYDRLAMQHYGEFARLNFPVSHVD
jgi:hypothetical protein